MNTDLWMGIGKIAKTIAINAVLAALVLVPGWLLTKSLFPVYARLVFLPLLAFALTALGGFREKFGKVGAASVAAVIAAAHFITVGAEPKKLLFFLLYGVCGLLGFLFGRLAKGMK